MPLFPDGLPQLHQAKLPLRFCIGDNPLEYAGETIAISSDNFMMTSPIELLVGSRLVAKIRVPSEDSGTPFTELAVSGRILCGTKFAHALFGYQVQIEHR